MPTLAFMSFGGAFLFMMTLAAVLGAYLGLVVWWWESRAPWATVVVIGFPVLVAWLVRWDLRRGKRDAQGDK